MAQSYVDTVRCFNKCLYFWFVLVDMKMICLTTAACDKHLIQHIMLNAFTVGMFLAVINVQLR